MQKTNEVIITNYNEKDIVKKIDLNIFGNHFDGNHITGYKIINENGNEKLIVEFSPKRIIKKYEKEKED